LAKFDERRAVAKAKLEARKAKVPVETAAAAE
jgi:hypothetical protein